MGVIKRGILGGFSGRVGNIVGSSWKGIAIIKSLPLSVANPRTAGQVAQRNKFTITVALASTILSFFLKDMWDRFASEMSGYNSFMSKNVELVSSDESALYEDFITSVGKMSETVASSVTALASEEEMSINWVDDSGTGLKLATDVVYAFAFGNDLSNILKCAATVTRAAGTIAIESSTALVEGDKLFYCLAFRRADGTVVSDSKIYTHIVTA